MKQQRIRVSNIHVGARLRPHTDAATVKAIAASIEKIGLQNPISIYFADDLEVDGEVMDNVPVLVSGAHRREALMSLGPKYEYVDCVVFDDKATARKWEISENLHRKDLTVDERSEHIAEWILLTEERLEEERQVVQVAPAVLSDGRKAGPQHQESGINAASRELGIEATAAKRAVKIASRTPEAKVAARAAGLDNNQKALLEIARAEPEKQVAKVQEIVERRASPKPKPTPKADEAVDVITALETIAGGIVSAQADEPAPWADEDSEVEEFKRLWSGMSHGAKKRAMDWAGLTREI